MRPQSEQANARTTAWAWWLNTDRWFLISVRKAFWSRLKAAKPLQVKTFAVSTCTRSEWKWLYWCFRVRVWLLTRARIRDRILAGFLILNCGASICCWKLLWLFICISRSAEYQTNVWSLTFMFMCSNSIKYLVQGSMHEKSSSMHPRADWKVGSFVYNWRSWGWLARQNARLLRPRDLKLIVKSHYSNPLLSWNLYLASKLKALACTPTVEDGRLTHLD